MKNITFLMAQTTKILFLVFSITICLNTHSKSKQLYMKVFDKGLIKKYDFENYSDIRNWTVKTGKLTISTAHNKDGTKSLLWSWDKNDRLIITNMEGIGEASGEYVGGIPEKYEPSFYPKGKYGGIKMWLYQEKSNNGQMVFKIGSNKNSAIKNPKYKFTINLNFTGWRAIWVQFEEDAYVKNYRGSDLMTTLVATPINNKKLTGKIFIDHLELLKFISYKRHSDFTFINNKKDKRVDSYEILTPYKKLLNYKLDKKIFNNNNLIKVNKTISERLEFLIIGNNKYKKQTKRISKLLKSKIKSAKKTYKLTNIKIRNGHIIGIPMYGTRDEHGADKSCTFQTLAQNTMFALALDYKLNKNKESKKELMNLFHHFIDQGWVAGSAIGTVDHIIRLSGIGTASFLLRSELKKEGILSINQKMLAWYTRLGKLIDIDKSKGENSDMVRGGAIVKLISIILMENNATKEGMLKNFSEYMNYVIAIAPGFMDTMKPDYSLYHHRGTYLNSYGVQAVNTMALIHWLLQDTPYQLSKESTCIIKNTLIRQSEITFGLELHYGVCGRFPYNNKAIDRFLIPAYAFMSMNNKGIKDSELASIFKYLYNISNPKALSSILFPALTYSGTFGTIELIAELNSKQQIATPPANKNIVMPFSGLQVHKIGKAYASVKGYSKYIWDYETGNKGENNLGRYLSHGMLIVAQTDPKLGFEGAGIEINNGFHWGYLPGATTKALPIEDIYFEDSPTKKYLEGYHRSYTKTSFVGGVSDGKNGIFSMELRDDVTSEKMVLFDSTFRAKKSYFFFGNDIICLGSNISNKDINNKTITTIFQNKFKKNNLILVNGKKLESLDYKKILDGGAFTDQQGVHYLVPKGNRVILEQNKQKSLTRINKKFVPTNEIFTKVWIDHGEAPNNSTYEYVILLNRPKNKTVNRTKLYLVKQQDKKAHVVRHIVSNITGFAIFDSTQKFNNEDIYGVDTPSILMWSRNKKDATLSISNPDLIMVPWNHNMSKMPLNITNGTVSASIVTVTLNGSWAPAKVIYELMSINQINNKTVIKIYCKNGKSINLPLRLTK